MIDFDSPVTYRSFEANTVSGSPKSGCQIERIELPGIGAVGYNEKRAKGDGRDGGDVYLDARRWVLHGTLYGATRAEAYDLMSDLSAAFSPTLAYAASPDTYGYLPFYFTRPTADTSNFPSGSFDAFINFRPLAEPTFPAITRDTTGIGSNQGLAVPWSCPMEAIDPLIYVDALTDIDISGAASGSGTFTQPGTYPTPLTIILVSDTDTAQDFDFIGINADLTIAIPELTAAGHTLTLGPDRILRQTYQGNETVEMGRITLNAEQTRPRVPAGGGAYSWSVDGGHNLLSGSVLRYRPAFI